MKLIIFFIVLNVFNVIIQTIKSLVTIKGDKITAALMNALTYGVYTVVLVYMTCNLPLWAKVVIVGGANFIGVYAVKWLEEKTTKAKMWKVEITTIDPTNCLSIIQELKKLNISSNTGVFQNIRTHVDNYIINAYCYNQNETAEVFELAKKFKAKYFINVSK